jgi:hypothetical protein
MTPQRLRPVLIGLLFPLAYSASANTDYINLPNNGYIGTASTVSSIGDIPVGQTGIITNFYGYLNGGNGGPYNVLWNGKFYANLGSGDTLQLTITEPQNFQNITAAQFGLQLSSSGDTASSTAMLYYSSLNAANPQLAGQNQDTNNNPLNPVEQTTSAIAADFSQIVFTATNHFVSDALLTFTISNTYTESPPSGNSSPFAPVVQYTVSAVPLPAAWPMFAGALAGFGFLRKQRKIG